MSLFRIEQLAGEAEKVLPCDIEKIQILNTKEEVDKYLLEVLRLKPKIIAFDYHGVSAGGKINIVCCSMCWQLIRSVSWQWVNTDPKLFRKFLESNDIGKTSQYHKQEIEWSENRFRRTTINNLIEYDYPGIIKRERRVNGNMPIERILKSMALNSLSKYKVIADQIIELGIIK